MNTFIKRFKEYFTPHKENDYKLHFSASSSILLLSAAMVVLFSLAVLQYTSISSGNNYLASVISSTLVDITNENRIAYGKGTLVMNPVLMGAAQAKANDMAEKSYFAHISPEGVTPWHWFDKVGYKFSYAGENLAVNFSDSIDVGEAWMNSPGHRANILNDHFTEIGIATSRGIYEGRPTIFVVQLFGRPALAQVAQRGQVVIKKETTAIEKTPLAIASTTVAITTPLKEVAGASLETITVNDMFVAVKNNMATDTNTVSTINIPETSWIARLLVSPQTTLTYAYMIFGVLIVLALALDTFIEIRRRHMVHLAYAVLLWIPLIAILYVGGSYIMTSKTTLTFAYVFLGTLITVALAIETFVEIRRKHSAHIVYALILWVLLFILLYVGQAYVFPHVIVL